MKTVILISALVIAYAINPEVLYIMGRDDGGPALLLVVGLVLSILTDVLGFIIGVRK